MVTAIVPSPKLKTLNTSPSKTDFTEVPGDEVEMVKPGLSPLIEVPGME